MPPKTTDELLREYLEGRPSEMLGKLFNELQETRSSLTRTFAEHEAKDDARHNTMIAAIGGHGSRIERLEKKISDHPPKRSDLGQYVTDTGSYRIPSHELDAMLEHHDAAEALEQKRLLIRGLGKIALAVLTAGAIFALGTLWRDYVGIHAPNQATITIAPATQPTTGKKEMTP